MKIENSNTSFGSSLKIKPDQLDLFNSNESINRKHVVGEANQIQIIKSKKEKNFEETQYTVTHEELENPQTAKGLIQLMQYTINRYIEFKNNKCNFNLLACSHTSIVQQLIDEIIWIFDLHPNPTFFSFEWACEYYQLADSSEIVEAMDANAFRFRIAKLLKEEILLTRMWLSQLLEDDALRVIQILDYYLF